MPHIAKVTRAAAAAVATSLFAMTLTSAASAGAQPLLHQAATKPTIVLVHGAWADGSSWSAVTQKLQDEGFIVAIAPNPLRGVASDSAYLSAYLATIGGPIVLVGHSYGGMVITNAAAGNVSVKSLVYVDAYIPDEGETVNQLTQAQPGSALAVDPTTVLNFVPIPNGGGNADLFVQTALFPGIFAADVPVRQAGLLAAAQLPLAASALSELSGTPAWKTIPSWDLIGTADQVIPPAEQQMMAARAGSHVVEVDAPHLSMVSKPGAVAELITAAASNG